MRTAALSALMLAGLIAGGAQAAPPSRAAAIKDPDTKAWWRIAETLSSDAMEGRDTGSAGYDRAAAVVAARFKAAGLKPAGDNGTWFQVFPVHESRVLELGEAELGKGQRPARRAERHGDDLLPLGGGRRGRIRLED